MNNKQTEALLFVARETSMITITEAAERILSDAGFTADEIATITGKVVKTKKTAPKTTAKKTARRRQNAWSRWTTDDDTTIEALWADGKTVTQIAKAMKRSTQSVNARIALLRATGSKIEYRNLGVRDARLNGSPKAAKFALPKK